MQNKLAIIIMWGIMLVAGVVSALSAPVAVAVLEPNNKHARVEHTVDLQGLKEAILRVQRSKVLKPIIATGISSTSFHELTRNLSAEQKQHITAIFADPNPVAQYHLAEVLLGGSANISVFDSKQNPFLKEIFKDLTNMPNLSVVSVNDDDDPYALFKNIIDTKALIAVPNRSIYNGQNIRYILKTLLRSHRVLIGYSPNLVRAGALATIYTPSDHINRDVTHVIEEYVVTGKLKPPHFPSRFEIAVNQRLARSLNIQIPKNLKEQIVSALGKGK